MSSIKVCCDSGTNLKMEEEYVVELCTACCMSRPLQRRGRVSVLRPGGPGWIPICGKRYLAFLVTYYIIITY